MGKSGWSPKHWGVEMSGIEYLRIYSDPDGSSHFEIKKIDMELKDFAPPAPPLMASPAEAADKSLFLELSPEWYGDWHPTPVRQWMILLTGELEFEVGDGRKSIQKAGDIVLLDDTSGVGHQTKVVGKESVRLAAIQF